MAEDEVSLDIDDTDENDLDEDDEARLYQSVYNGPYKAADAVAHAQLQVEVIKMVEQYELMRLGFGQMEPEVFLRQHGLTVPVPHWRISHVSARHDTHAFTKADVVAALQQNGFASEDIDVSIDTFVIGRIRRRHVYIVLLRTKPSEGLRKAIEEWRELADRNFNSG